MEQLEGRSAGLDRRIGAGVLIASASGQEADAVKKTDNRYKPPRVFWAVETERLGQVPLMRLLRGLAGHY